MLFFFFVCVCVCVFLAVFMDPIKVDSHFMWVKLMDV